VESENELQKDVRADLESERDQLLERAKKAQVEEYLLKKHQARPAGELLDPPDRPRRVPPDRRAAAEGHGGQRHRGADRRAATSAQEEVGAGLRVAFILDKVAETLKVEGHGRRGEHRDARMARLYKRRFDRVRDDLQSRGLFGAARRADSSTGKCLEALLKDAKLVGAPADEKEST